MARPTISKTPLGQRLTAVRKAAGYEDRLPFAELLGMHPDTLGGYERGDSAPGIDFLTMYKRRFSVNLDWLVSGDGEMFAAASPALDESQQNGGVRFAGQSADVIAIPRYDVQAAAGDGIIPVSENAEDSGISIARSFLRRIGAHPNSCILLESKGDSMLPSIPGGSLLVVDRSKTEIEDDMVFVFRVGPGIKVKRAVWRIDGNLDLVSDNEKYPPETYGPDRADEIAPIGQVMLVLRHP